jgi:hypothetical protein
LNFKTTTGSQGPINQKQKGTIMKKVIDGKVYNTETAECLHNWDNGHYGNDFRSCEESLYKTKKGAYFLHGEGGPMSKYAQNCGNNSVCGGQGIEPISEKVAMEWLEEHNGDDVLISLFGGHIEEA